MATIHAALGETQQACEALSRALADHSQLVGFLSSDPAIDRLARRTCLKDIQQRLVSG